MKYNNVSCCSIAFLVYIAKMFPSLMLGYSESVSTEVLTFVVWVIFVLLQKGWPQKSG